MCCNQGSKCSSTCLLTLFVQCDHQDYVYCADFENLDYGEGSREDNPPGYAGLVDPSARRLDDAEVGEGGRWVLRGGNCDAHGQWFDENPNNSA